MHLNIGPQIDFYSNKIWLSKLIGKLKDNYAFLAFAQQTKYAVVPLHTEDEFNLFHMQCLLEVNMPLHMDYQTLTRWFYGGQKKQIEKQFSTSYENI